MLFRSALSLLIMFSLSACATVNNPQLQTSLATQSSIQPSGGILHTVQKGETLWRISKTYQIDLEDILKTNKIPDSNNISVGQTIIIPGGTAKNAMPQINLASNDNMDFIWPIKGKIITQFRQKRDGVSNKGIDILPQSSQDILASREGKVIFIGDLPGYGKTIIVDHLDGFLSVYCGASSVNVNISDQVKQGMAVARTGNPPRQEYGALHFQIRKKHKPQNPLYYLN